MFQRRQENTPSQVAHESSPVVEVLDRTGLTPDLPQRLAQDVQGRPFTPVQVLLKKDVVQQLALLLRREPVGGAEPQIAENRAQIEAQALHLLHRFLAGGTGSPRSVVQDLLHETRQRKARLETRHAHVAQDYAAAQDLLHPWQERVGKRAGKTSASVWGWLVGGAGQMSLPEAGTLWNRREELALRQATGSAALAIYDRVLATLTDLDQHLDAVLSQARRTRRELAQRREEIHQSSPVFAPWTVRIAPAVISTALSERADIEGLVGDLLQQAGVSADATLLDGCVQDLARQAAARLLDGVTLSDLIELDAQAGGSAPDGDALVLVGQALVHAVQQPTWQLTRDARPRSETIQVTPDGLPVYDLDGLRSAAYGDGLQRLGFVQVQLHVALDDLVLLRESDGSFEAALQQRNLYVVDALAAQHPLVRMPHPPEQPAAYQPVLSVSATNHA